MPCRFLERIIPGRSSCRSNSLGRLFAQLEQLGEFDDSLIVVASDHGSGMSPDVYLETPVGKRLVSPSGVAESRRNFAKDKARGVSLLLVKRAQATGPMVVSDRAASAVDVPATIAAEFGATEPSTGESLFAVGQGLLRTRKYAAFDYSENKTSYVGPITLNTVTGNSWDDASWVIAECTASGAGSLNAKRKVTHDHERTVLLQGSVGLPFLARRSLVTPDQLFVPGRLRSLCSVGPLQGAAGTGALDPSPGSGRFARATYEAWKVIKPERVGFISYPYEWSFSQLKDAALLTLSLQKTTMRFGMTLKDASAYNVQFVGGKAVFIDTLSFERRRSGEPWAAYSGFFASIFLRRCC